jgi:hypothetical protein
MLRKRFTPLVAIFVSMVAFAVAAFAQDVSLQDQLAAQYKLVKMGSDTNGYSVVEEGTLLAVPKGGLLGIPYKTRAFSSINMKMAWFIRPTLR